jgi:hypothetical protein
MTNISAFATGDQQFSIARVLATSFAVLMRNLVPFGILTAIISIPYIVLSFWGVVAAAKLHAAGHDNPFTGTFAWTFVALALLILLTTILTQSAINYGTFQDLRGERPALLDCLARGLSTLPRVLVAGILGMLAIGFAFLLLIVPGVILLVMWWVFVPVLVVERGGIFECFTRSSDLTRGARWEILGILAVLWVSHWAIGFIFGLIGALLGPVGAEILSTVVTLFFTAFGSVLSAVGYYYLRADKEGIAIEDIAGVFD